VPSAALRLTGCFCHPREQCSYRGVGLLTHVACFCWRQFDGILSVALGFGPQRSRADPSLHPLLNWYPEIPKRTVLSQEVGLVTERGITTLRQSIKKVFYFGPWRLGRCGFRSYIFRPRLINGPEHIEVGNRTMICSHSWLSAITEYAGERFQPQLVFGDDVYVGRYACIVATQRITIEDGCVLSEHVYISDNSHGFSPIAGPIMKQRLFHKGGVRLGPHCFVGYRACILSGVQLGERCVVGANAVVTKSFPAFSMVGGIPAKLLKKYSPEADDWVSVEDTIA